MVYNLKSGVHQGINCWDMSIIIWQTAYKNLRAKTQKVPV